MSKPKNMTPEEEAAWREKHREHQRAYVERNREKVMAHQRAWRENNRERCRELNRAWRENNREKVLEGKRVYREANREKVIAKDRAYNRKKTESLADGYVAKKLRIPVAQAPKDLIELKRQQLQLKRLTDQLIKEIENGE